MNTKVFWACAQLAVLVTVVTFSIVFRDTGILLGWFLGLAFEMAGGFQKTLRETQSEAS